MKTEGVEHFKELDEDDRNVNYLRRKVEEDYGPTLTCPGCGTRIYVSGSRAV